MMVMNNEAGILEVSGLPGKVTTVAFEETCPVFRISFIAESVICVIDELDNHNFKLSS